MASQRYNDEELLGDIHKPRGQLRGRGIIKRPFYCISDLEGESKIPKNLTPWFIDDPLDPSRRGTVVACLDPLIISCAISRPTNCSKKNQCWERPCKKGAPNLEVHLDRIIQVLWQKMQRMQLFHRWPWMGDIFWPCKFHFCGISYFICCCF